MTAPRIFYDSRFADGGLVASSTASGYHADNLTDWRPYTWWKPTALPATVTVDCGSAKAADYWFVYGHDLASQGATIELRGSTDNFGVSNVLVDSLTPSTDRPFVRTFAQASYRYWRLRITGTTMPSIAIAAAGLKLELPGYLALDFDPVARRMVGQTNRNERGQPLGKIVDFVEREQRIVVRRVSWSWLRQTFVPVWNAHLRAVPFGFVWNAAIDAEPWLATMGDEIETPHHAAQLCDIAFTLRNVVE